jgi:hypothetical protein
LNILQNGDGGKLRIPNDISDFLIIGTNGNINDDTTNTNTHINGNTCTFAGAAGSIQYFTTGSRGQIFYNGTVERMGKDYSGNITIRGQACVNCVNLSKLF